MNEKWVLEMLGKVGAVNTDVGKGREFLARKLVKDLAKST